MFDAFRYSLKNLVKKILPPGILPSYHRVLAVLAAAWYGFPSKKMIIIGVTGTKGKTTVVHLIAHILRCHRSKVGYTSGLEFSWHDGSLPNLTKMTMPGPFILQRMMSKMVQSGCAYAVIETTSEGIVQSRHLGIDYDIVALTNLSPEHIESHGSFEAYRAAKGKLLASLATRKKKSSFPFSVKVLNRDDDSYEFFSQFYSDRTVAVSRDSTRRGTEDMLVAEHVAVTARQISFSISGRQFTLPFTGAHNVSNALIAIAATSVLGMSLSEVSSALASSRLPDGRFQMIHSPRGFTVVVDYAHEPASLRASYEAVRLFKPKRIFAVFGCTGGGRDTWRRPVMGALAAEYADVVIITTDDPYDDRPESIIAEVAAGVRTYGKKKFTEGENLFLITGRRGAIRKALSEARAGDLVMITGKGGEKVMAVRGGKLIPWDDSEIVREAFKSV